MTGAYLTFDRVCIKEYKKIRLMLQIEELVIVSNFMVQKGAIVDCVIGMDVITVLEEAKIEWKDWLKYDDGLGEGNPTIIMDPPKLTRSAKEIVAEKEWHQEGVSEWEELPYQQLKYD